jgi:isocitrate dehydrogenase
VSKDGTERLVRAAIEYAIEFKRKSVTIVHKGNIMKYTEGAFRNWGYALAEREFGDQVYTWDQWERTKAAKGEAEANAEQKAAIAAGKVIIKDAIADITLQQVLTRPSEFDVIATLNLNGDYLSDALAAQVGGIGIAPGGNINYVTGHAVFEATHGTAPKYAGPRQGQPGLGDPLRRDDAALHGLGRSRGRHHRRRWTRPSANRKTVTYDFARLMEGATEVKCSEFADELIKGQNKIARERTSRSPPRGCTRSGFTSGRDQVCCGPVGKRRQSDMGSRDGISAHRHVLVVAVWSAFREPIATAN